MQKILQLSERIRDGAFSDGRDKHAQDFTTTKK